MEVTFKARARTLDMLGRQQIAGIPTAISELFKNAHDADAERVEVDYYRSDGLFVLRDDGFGMETQEFVDRWLTIATETSIERKRADRQRPKSRKRGRPILGEKGIGRLAIATIAPQVLVLTRASRDGVLSDLTAAFLNWRVFECPGLNLQDIRIPLRTFPGGSLPNGEDIAGMVDDFRSRNARLRERVDDSKWARIETELARFKVDPLQMAEYMGKPELLGNGHGTHFYLLPASANLAFDIAGDPTSDVAPPLQKALLGFTTPSFANGGSQVIRTAFRDHGTDGTCDDLIGDSEFFTRYEYENADHRVWGRFDEYGQFKGSVSVYGDIVNDHVIRWAGGKGKKTGCGPFHIRFAAAEGLAKNSTLPPEEHGRLLSKTKRIGGLYIYRDGVRVQPYGNVDYDWLEIELRRNKSASYYYFSYRQMFGVVEVDSTHNGRLREKAGREGFRENKAYRDLRGILRSFLVQVAADFFREKGVHGERFASRKREFKEIDRHRRARAEKATAERNKFKRDLTKFFDRMETENPHETVMTLGLEIESRVREAGLDSDRNRAATRILQIEGDARRSLRELESRYRLSKPRIGLSKPLQREWRDYQEAFEDLQSSIADIRDSIESVVTKEVDEAGVNVSARKRMEAALRYIADLAMRQINAGRGDVEETTEDISRRVHLVATRCVGDVEATIHDVMAEFGRRDLADLDDQRLIAVRRALEAPIREALENASRTLDSLRAQLAAMDVTGGSSVVDQLVAVEQSNVALEEQAAVDFQLAQLGMAIEIISHEFGAAIRSVRSGLRSLKAWADVNHELMSLYQGIRGSFDHLDGYLTLFTPLQRRLYRKAVDIHGWEIHEFLTNLFGQRMARHDVELTRTDAFANAIVRGYPSAFYPVFVNLVDNAIYWLSGQHERLERRIQLDALGRELRVSDSGPGVHARDRDDIFEIGFTRKPGGRGMGLHISRATLREAGYDLILGDPGAEWSSTFLIAPIKDPDKDTR
ncbi:MAG: sensor histidine kinase [Gemmatimonadetes bacterium]|nr:sensor histidine kinase [Gemmatimonadota bacterium]MYE93475.1 sensor histidine kinase [Gemmatimonadota bacterium]